ncbi:prephenate dehydratase [Aeoliella mucimassa]|uniref:Bifunctional chorismate mutase/prephenate dehydratase n=1 Tax=Aeoliella mucimassa TaxID=2527972 RepID=A0A518ASZ7_9BACT|nr:prephenate dehydratase [Aeoliella mucimassa]QDU57863.1 P-protein [Aeoliella mucimassa]
MAKKKTARTGGPKREIDKLDREILKLINERAELASDARTDLSAVVQKAMERNRGPLDGEAIGAVFREISAACQSLSHAERIAYLGPEHTFSHIAAIEQFGVAADLVPVATIAAVFEEVEQGTAAYGIVPLENSTDGRVSDTLECFARSQVSICGELPLVIHHCLLGSGSRAEVRRVESKPQALSQCRNWLAKHLPGAECHPVASTADAARKAASDPSVAAIASAQAAKAYGLEVLVPNIEDNKDNVTRFAVIAREMAGKSGNDKTALMLEINHEPGALADAMGVFKRNRLNMTWIESFPVAGSRGRYLFFIEFVGHATEARSKKALLALEKKAQQLVVLGSYAHREPIG